MSIWSLVEWVFGDHKDRRAQPTVWDYGKVTEWKHGFQSRYVRATRYTSKSIGFNIGFVLPKHPYDCDRADMFRWMREHGCHIYQGGGGPGAEIFATVDGVKSIDDANVWLPKFLPEFDAWIKRNLN